MGFSVGISTTRSIVSCRIQKQRHHIVSWTTASYRRSLLQKSPIKETIFCKRVGVLITCDLLQIWALHIGAIITPTEWGSQLELWSLHNSNSTSSSYQDSNSFAEYSLFYRALLQKRPIILRSLLTVAAPYENSHRMEFSIGVMESA